MNKEQFKNLAVGDCVRYHEEDWMIVTGVTGRVVTATPGSVAIIEDHACHYDLLSKSERKPNDWQRDRRDRDWTSQCEENDRLVALGKRQRNDAWVTGLIIVGVLAFMVAAICIAHFGR